MRTPLAPMDGLFRALTWGLFGLLGLMVLVDVWLGLQSGWVAVMIAVLFAGIWLAARPRAFVVTPEALEIQFWAWCRRIPRADIVAAEVITAKDFSATYRYGLRIGAGGLWGTFGWLHTAKGLVEVWISRRDRYVHIRRVQGRNLLITPADARGLCEALGQA